MPIFPDRLNGFTIDYEHDFMMAEMHLKGMDVLKMTKNIFEVEGIKFISNSDIEHYRIDTLLSKEPGNNSLDPILFE